MSRAPSNRGVRGPELELQEAAAFIAKLPQEHIIDGWPVKPRALRRRDFLWIVIFILDVISVLLALSFVVLAFMTIGLDGQEISAWGNKVKAATLLGPTIFPIVFARIVSRTVKASALFRAGKGAKLGVLEQLMGSVTIFSALEVQLLLRSFNLLGCTLLLVWALSPLGGQASLRLLGEGTHSSQSQRDLRYLSSDSYPIFTGADSMQTFGFAVNGLYSAAMFSPPKVQAASMDLWGNVKIPAIEALESGNSDPEGWLTVNPLNATYSSLIGLPIDGMAISDQSSFTVESSYMTLNCPLLDYIDRETFNWTSVLSEQYHISQPNNDSAFFHGTNPFGFFVDSKSNFSRHGALYPNDSPSSAAPPYVLFASEADGGNGATLANCSLTRSSVESKITCQRYSCAVTQMRRSIFDHRPSDYTPLGSTVRQNFWLSWADAAGISLHPNTATPTELFIQNGSLTAALTTLDQSFSEVNLYQLPADTFSERLSLLWNTYWQCGYAPWYQTGNLPSNLTAFSDQASSGLIVNATTASITYLRPVYVSNHSWAIILLIGSLLLFICAIYGTILKYKTVAPDVLGYVSSLTRDNPYVPLPGGGTALDGLERARLLKNMRVRLQDVTPGDPQGHIALRYDEWPNAGKLTTQRLYGGMPQGLRI